MSVPPNAGSRNNNGRRWLIAGGTTLIVVLTTLGSMVWNLASERAEVNARLLIVEEKSLGVLEDSLKTRPEWQQRLMGLEVKLDVIAKEQNRLRDRLEGRRGP